jgi:HEAT repeat protein
MRLGVGIVSLGLLLAAAAYADDLAAAKRDLTAPAVGTRRVAIDKLVRLDSRASVDVLIAALRRAHKDDARLQRAFFKEANRALKRVRELTKQLEQLTEDLRRQRKEGKREDPSRSLAEATEIMRQSTAEFKKMKAARREFMPHVVLLVDGARALGRFQSREAVERIEGVARHEPAGPVRNAALRALIDRSSAELLPTLLALAQDRDPRVRALAVRALRRHASAPGVLDRLAACAQDKCWQVRRGAYAAIARAPADRALPLLKGALAAEEGDQLRLLQGHVAALEQEMAPPPPKPGAFGLRWTSTRVRFVLDLSERMKHLKLRYLRGEMVRALEALPDGARFEIVGLAGTEVRFAPRPQTMNAGTRRRAIDWVRELKPLGPGQTYRLFGLLAPDYGGRYRGKRVFEGLADTIVLVVDEVEEDDARHELDSFLLGNRACDAVLHVVALGAKVPRGMIEDRVNPTGGSLVLPK